MVPTRHKPGTPRYLGQFLYEMLYERSTTAIPSEHRAVQANVPRDATVRNGADLLSTTFTDWFGANSEVRQLSQESCQTRRIANKQGIDTEIDCCDTVSALSGVVEQPPR